MLKYNPYILEKIDYTMNLDANAHSVYSKFIKAYKSVSSRLLKKQLGKNYGRKNFGVKVLI